MLALGYNEYGKEIFFPGADVLYFFSYSRRGLGTRGAFKPLTPLYIKV